VRRWRTLHQHLGNAETIAAGLARVRDIGDEGVELAGLGPIEAERLDDLLRKNGLAACSAHVRWDRLRDETDVVAEDCRTWGCGHVAVPVMPPQLRSAEGYARFAVEASAVGGSLREAGIRLSYHNHAFELERFGGESGLGTGEHGG